MAYMSIDDPDFFARMPENLKHIQAGRSDGGNLAYFPMGDAKDNPPTVACLKIGPNGILGRHTHNCYRFEVIVRGTLDVGGRILKPGDVMVSKPYVFYGPHVAGPEGCTTFEIFSTYTGSHTPIMETKDGLVEFDNSVPGTIDRMRALMAEQNAQTLKPQSTPPAKA
jgi:hypothetical protein